MQNGDLVIRCQNNMLLLPYEYTALQQHIEFSKFIELKFCTQGRKICMLNHKDIAAGHIHSPCDRFFFAHTSAVRV